MLGLGRGMWAVSQKHTLIQQHNEDRILKTDNKILCNTQERIHVLTDINLLYENKV